MSPYRRPRRRRSRRRTRTEHAATVACVALGLSIPLVWPGSPVETGDADPIVLGLFVAAAGLSMVAWHRHGSQGSLSWMMVCLISGAGIAIGLTKLA